jgi:hypothetical protein
MRPRRASMPPCDGRRVILLRSLADEDYWADHGLPVIRDEATDDPGPELEELLEENATDAQPGGTIATAGFGWLWAKTSGADDEHHVRLDVHDNVPPDDQSSWPDVVETPYRSDGGIVRLGWMTADGGEDPLLLGPPGCTAFALRADASAMTNATAAPTVLASTRRP